MERLQVGFSYEFYNAGNRIQENMRFSISPTSAGFNSDGNEVHSYGFWPLDAPKEGFFRVPVEIKSGNETLRVQFADDVQRRFGKMGVILVDPDWDASKEDPEKDIQEYPIAPSRDAAVLRGEKIWKLWLRKIVEEHIADCQNAMAAGGAPRAARGFTKRAFEILGIGDPGEQYFLGLKEAGKTAGNGHVNEALLEIQGQNQAMMAIVLAIASGQKIDPELLKSMIVKPANGSKLPAPAPIQTSVPENAGKVEVLSQEPVTAAEPEERKFTDRKSRSAAAAKALAEP